MEQIIAGKTVTEWENAFPLMSRIMDTKEVFWENPNVVATADLPEDKEVTMEDILEAEALFTRFAPFIRRVFPETEMTQGQIESPFKHVSHMKQMLEDTFSGTVPGDIWLKCDNELAIAGSIKARGGFYEILAYAEKLAIDNGMLLQEDNYEKLANDAFQSFFSNYSIAVGSTGNLGLSIGIISAKLGFHVTVHMSKDAKEWKKSLLRKHGVVVEEHEGDFSEAVDQGRNQCQRTSNCYFVDDEDSRHLFLGYAVAALRLKRQIQANHLSVNEQHPLVVYLPCGVGGGPSGVAFGLKKIFGDNVYCYFAEPTHSPSVLLGLMTGRFHEIAVQDFGIDNLTAADGLAVGRPSRYALDKVKHIVNGVYTIDDHMLYRLLYLLHEAEGIKLEPSALAGMYGPKQWMNKAEPPFGLEAHHVVWATGGNLVPEQDMESYIQYGKQCMEDK
ncbi:D-serine ammonia-lyase [Pontibacillus salicampi]|uniref:Probable D-serine dehydratase n=1 Tax=Pontibacillus salicampi TaxID=1449801 RepID=A0ABV6LSS8_9BACI